MAHRRSFTIRNCLLRALSPDDLNLLQPFLEPVIFNSRDVLVEPNKPIKHVHFIEQGIAAGVAISHGDKRIEVFKLGREGMSGTPLIHDLDRSPHLTFVHVAGSALRMRFDAFRAAMEASASLRKLLLHYAHIVAVEMAHTALATGCFPIKERLARWIVMCDDRLDGDYIPLTHDFAALMLGVRRAGVTIALQALEREHIIEMKRGYVMVLDRARLEALAGDSYGPPEAEYRRIIGLRRGQSRRPKLGRRA